jgi:hypothetical protein
MQICVTGPQCVKMQRLEVSGVVAVRRQRVKIV